MLLQKRVVHIKLDFFTFLHMDKLSHKNILGRHDRHRMVVGFTTTCVISAYHHESCEFESRSADVSSIQQYVIKFVKDLRQIGGFLHQ
jgi:hypothetical protein